MVGTLVLVLSVLSVGSLSAQEEKRRNTGKAVQEESEDYFKKWLSQDVKYIISDQERDVFNKLTTDEEKENFIEQFWLRRDPDIRTSENEFKEEHYRRIAFANQYFQSGKPGWMTDRGRTYVIHGEPAYIERYPSGGSYHRKSREGGGVTFTYPFEVWLYHRIAGIGEDVELEFVDRSFSGEYRLAMRPEEKDMLLYVPGTAPTIMELLGRESGRIDRPYFNPLLENNSAWLARHGYTERDTPFQRLNRYVVAQKAPEIEFYDLKQIVEANITYNDFPFQMRSDFVQLNDVHVLAPVTVQVEHRDLTFDRKGNLVRAEANIYGLVRSMIGEIVAEFEDSVVAEYPYQDLDRVRSLKSVYQKQMVLDSGRRYRVDVVVRDENTNRVGVVSTSLSPPKLKLDGPISTGSLILSRSIQAAPADARMEERFILGTIKIIPNVDNTFFPGEWMGVYLQVYNVDLDQTSLRPDIRVRYTIRHGGRVINELLDNQGDTIHYFSPQRVVLIRQIQLDEKQAAGRYELDMEIEDRIGEENVRVRQVFTVEPRPDAMTASE